MKLLSATDFAIAEAIKARDVRIVGRTGRLGAYWSIEDDHGVIEVANTAEEAHARVAAVDEALKAGTLADWEAVQTANFARRNHAARLQAAGISNRPGDMAAEYAEENGVDYSTALARCNMD